MILINEQELQQTGLTPAEFIASRFKGVLEENDALVCCISHKEIEKGYLLGVATRNEKGYTPTNYVLAESDYNIASEWIDQANEAIFNRDKKETSRIVLSTMSFNNH